MNGGTIESILSKYLGDTFKGVFSLDQWRLLPVSRPAAYVFNTQPQHVSFGHWVAIFIYKTGKAVFFDAFGRSAEHLGFHLFLEKHSISYTYNSVMVQNPLTLTCGQHVILFLMNAKNLSKWIKKMNNNLLENDYFVYDMFSRDFGVKSLLFPNLETLLF